MIEYLNKVQMKALYHQLFPKGEESECLFRYMKPMLACSLHRTERCVKISCEKKDSLEEESICVYQEAVQFLKNTDRKITTLHFLCDAETGNPENVIVKIFSNAVEKGEEAVGLGPDNHSLNQICFEGQGWPTMILLFEIETNIWDDWGDVYIRFDREEAIKKIIGE